MLLNSILAFKSYKKDVYGITKDLIFFVTGYLKKNFIYQKLFNELGIILNIPQNILEKRANQLLFRSYEFKLKKFNVIFSYKKTLSSFAFLIFYLIYFLFNCFFYKKRKIKKFELICDNIHEIKDINHHNGFSNYFKSVLLIGYDKLDYSKPNIKLINIKKQYFSYVDFPFKKRLSLIFFVIKILLLSIKCKHNFFIIFKCIIFDFIKYKKIYSEYKGKYYFNYRFYDTNILQNYLFKQSGGLKTSCFQKNLCILSLSCFVYTDIFFSLGKNQGKICNDLGGEIKKFKPVGSFFMEDKWFKSKKDLTKIPKIDILIIGINAPWPRGCINNDFHDSYYNKFLPWMKKLAEDYPQKKIYYKHHNYFAGDPRERNILSQSKINVIVDDKSINGTYGWAYKSKTILSFASTMIIELLGNDKEAFFVDPNGINDQWYYGVKKIKKYRIKSYENLKKIINKKNLVKNLTKENKNYFCLNSKCTKRNIATYLKKF